MNRRSFMQSILAAGVAPYVVTSSGVLMPVRQIWTPQTFDPRDYRFRYVEVDLDQETLEYQHSQARSEFSNDAIHWRTPEGAWRIVDMRDRYR